MPELELIIPINWYFSMPRTYRRQYSKAIVRVPKKSWNVGQIFAKYDTQQFVENNLAITTICINSLDNSTPTSTVIQAKHIKVYGSIALHGNVTQAGAATPVMVTSYIMYVPQIVYKSIDGASGTTSALYTYLINLVRDHPEWIMSQKNVNVKFNGGIPGENDITKFTQTSGKMKRNLKSGDRIIHALLFNDITGSANYNRGLYFDFTFLTSPN